MFPSVEGSFMRRSNFRRRVWLPATAAAGLTGLRFHELRHTAATLASASKTSTRAIMARIGHNSMTASLRYQHVLDGQDEEIVGLKALTWDFLVETMGIEPTTPCLQSRIGRFHDQAWIGEGPGQMAFPLAATTAERPRSPIEKGT